MGSVQEEFRDYKDKGFNPVKTGDGSYTLKQSSLEEEMHSRSGALSESLYIYYETTQSFLKEFKAAKPQVISVGLGLGYNEVLAAHTALSLNLEAPVISFEKEEALISLFKKRISKPKTFSHYFSFFEESLDFNKEEVSSYLQKHLVCKKELSLDSLKEIKSSSQIILFDAYSNKTSESLWTPHFLDEFLSLAKTPSMISTYACTGDLNRALKKAGFDRQKRAGFGTKRESTFAVKSLDNG